MWILYWPAFIWRILPSKSKVAYENLHFQRHTNLLIKLQWSVFSSATSFLEGSQQNFFLYVSNQHVFNMDARCRIEEAEKMNKSDKKTPVIKIGSKLIIITYDSNGIFGRWWGPNFFFFCIIGHLLQIGRT